MRIFFVSLSLLAFLTGCKGSIDAPVMYQAEITQGSSGETRVFVVDRKVLSIVLDVSQEGMAVFDISVIDKMIIDGKMQDVPWTMRVRLYEGPRFKVKKAKEG